ncbi:MAG: hypothetical protein KA105_07580 [Caulobacter sp.]|nr:hypothetical protein [Caulobacter sp.]
MSRYLTSIVEQALWSLLNLGVTLLLAKLAAPEAFGTFVFWSSTAYVLSSVQNALTVTHLMVLPPVAGTDPARRDAERLMLIVTFAFLAVVAVGVFAGSLTFTAAGSGFGAEAAALFVPAFLLQQYVRFLCFSRGEAKTAAIQTGLVLLLAMALLGGGWALLKPLTATDILLLLGAAYGVVGVAGLARSARGLLGGLRWSELKGYVAYAKNAGWIFLGVTSSELLARFYVFAVGGALGNAVLAMLSFSQTFLRPVPLLATAWSMVGRGDLVRRREARQWGGFARMILSACVGGLVLAAAWSFVVWQVWPLVTERLFDGRYAEARSLLPLWGLAAALGLVQAVLSTGLQVLRAFKALAIVNAAASLVAAGVILLAMGPLGYVGAVLGTAFGQGVEAAAMLAVLVVWLRRSASGSSGPGPSPRSG